LAGAWLAGRVVAEAPRSDVPVPAPVAAVAAGEPLQPVWENELGGLTFALGTGPSRRFVKWAPAGSGLDLRPEVARLAWAGRFVTVPSVLSFGESRLGQMLVTAGLPGENAVSPRWVADPAPAVRAIGRGLRHLHDTLPAEACPYTWSVADRLAGARADADLTGLADPPPVDRLVVCHGDACSPNTLVSPAGECTGHVDLGSLGLADRWADLAVATWSLDWNYGPGWEPLLLATYGVDPDPVRTAYYRRLWDVDP
jgi:kanamycin kinase